MLPGMASCPACGRANPAKASFCMACAAPLGTMTAPHEVRKTVTVVFCDLVGSTTLSERHDPEVLRPLLHAYFEEMRGAVERHGGRVEKFIGDAVSAVFGLPVAHEDDALRAVRAAVEMHERLAALAGQGPILLACRIGVTTGEVLVPADDEPLIGDAMNTAARLQASAEPGTVLVGEPTYRLVRDAAVLEPINPLVLKGKAEPVRAYRVVQVASLSPMRTRHLDAPMVGRGRESILLAGAFERAATDRACQLYTVLGVAGAGKSRLVEEFLVAAAGDATVLRGRCLPYGEGITWYPMTEALKGALGLSDFADEATIHAAIHAAVGAEEHAASIEGNLARLLTAGEGGSPEETFWAIRRLLELLGRGRPLVLVLDDIHWGEPLFLDFVEHVAEWSRDTAMLVLAMARPDLLDIRPTWGGGKTNATTISLAPLSEPECGQLIAALLGSPALPAAARDRITVVAEGNPLFVEEMLRMLVDDGRLVRDGEGWVAAGDLTDVHVPATISALLSARLDRLSAGDRAIIEAASVAGRDFHRGAVGALLPAAAQAGIDAHLRALTRKDLIASERSTLPGEDAYRFRHLLIRDAAYDAIPKAERARLHVAFADWLEQVAGARIAELEAIVGYHLERAHRYRQALGLPEDAALRLRAAQALGAAGARALDAGDARAAIALLRPATELTQGDRAQLQILVDFMGALTDSGAFDEARSVAGRLAEAAAASNEPAYAMRARMHLFADSANNQPVNWDADAAHAFLEAALRTYREAGAQRFMPQALGWLGTIAVSQGSESKALGLAAEALDAALALGDRRWVAICLLEVLEAIRLGPMPLSEGIARATRFVERFAGDRAVLPTALLGRGAMAARLGQSDQARLDVALARTISVELGRHALDDVFPWVEGFAVWGERDLLQALAKFEECSASLAAQGDPPWAFVSAPLARVLLELGRDDDAEQVLAAMPEDPSVPGTMIQRLTLSGVIAARRGDFEAALRRTAEAVAAAAATDRVVDQGDVALDRGEVLRLAGRLDDARTAAADALERYARKEYAIGVWHARAMLGGLPG
jgi:class 3 adenylate cyclase